MRDRLLKWFAGPDVGLSSKAMAMAALGIDFDPDYPHDPSDFNRCLLLLLHVPEVKPHMHKLAAVSPQWSRLIARWDEIEASFLCEVGLNWSKGGSAPKTYQLMRDVLKD
jgi:hypothetical protein